VFSDPAQFGAGGGKGAAGTEKEGEMRRDGVGLTDEVGGEAWHFFWRELNS